MHRLTATASHVALAATILLGAPAAAQEAATPATDPVLEDGAIVVTARRREENLVDVPIAVSAYSAEALAQSGAIDITDMVSPRPTPRSRRAGAPIRRFPHSSAAWASRTLCRVSSRAWASISTMSISTGRKPR